jgi:hypothetical protein
MLIRLHPSDSLTERNTTLKNGYIQFFVQKNSIKFLNTYLNSESKILQFYQN